MVETSHKDFGRVAVLMGGWSAERAISLLSGEEVLQALLESGVDAHRVDVGHDISEVLSRGKFDRAFNVLHGRGGEDGTMQGLMNAMNLPYTGSDVLGSALAMDKCRSKQVWMSMGFASPEFVVLETEEDCVKAVKSLGLPLIVKPVLEGSSIGMSKVDEASQMVAAFDKARECKGCIIAETWVQGGEYTAAIVGRRVLPMIKLETPRAFYDYVAKYESDDTKYICPCGLDQSFENELAEWALNAFDALGASGWGRVDFIVDSTGKPWLIEVDTIPGMTDHSLVPMAARHAGISFNQLVVAILDGSYA